MLTFFQEELSGLVSSAKMETLEEVLAGLNLGIKIREDSIRNPDVDPDYLLKTQTEIDVLSSMETWLEQFQDKIKRG